jgi:hypothetical protein
VSRQDAVVDWIVELSRLAAAREAEEIAGRRAYLEVRLGSGESGLLDMSVHRSVVWADVLRSLQQRKHPAYLEVDPDTRLITEVLVPLRVTVGRIEPIEDGLVVELIISHAPHYLRRSNDLFEELRATLEAARDRNTPLLVTETEDHEIVDVRPLDEPAESSG